MFDDRDEKLENLMKLKKEMEKDLKKKGLLKEKPKEQKETKIDEETVKRLKENITSPSHISEDKSLTLYDINFQDYDANIEAISKTLKIFINKATDVNKKIIFEGIDSLLSGNFQKAKASFQQARGIEAKYDKLVSELYMGNEISQEMVAFLKENPNSLYPLLLILERELIKGTSEGMEKVLQILAKKSEFWNFIYNLYLGDASLENLTKATREGGFATLILLLALYIDPTRDYPIQSHTCLNVHKAFLRGETITAPNWCLFGQIAMSARKYLSGYRPDTEIIKKFEKSPEGKLFLAFYYYNENNHTIAKEYFKIFEAQVGEFKIYTKPIKQNKIGMEQFIAIPKDFINLAGEKLNILNFLKENPGLDVYIKFKYPEFPRLAFSEEHCRTVYR